MAAPQAQPLQPWEMPAQSVYPPLNQAQKYERLAFMFCKMGTTGLIVWVLTPPFFVLLVAAVAIVLYGRALALGIRRSKCILRKPLLIMGFWSAVIAMDLVFLWWQYR